MKNQIVVDLNNKGKFIFQREHDKLIWVSYELSRKQFNANTEPIKTDKYKIYCRKSWYSFQFQSEDKYRLFIHHRSNKKEGCLKDSNPKRYFHFQINVEDEGDFLQRFPECNEESVMITASGRLKGASFGKAETYRKAICIDKLETKTIQQLLEYALG